MPEPNWPPLAAWNLLDEMYTDPYGWSYYDIEKLLDRWSVTEIVERNWNWCIRRHPDAPELEIGYPLSHGDLSAATVKHVCDALRTLHRRLR